MAGPNNHLRRARERIESPNATGEPLSRQELAELVNAWVYDNTSPPCVWAFGGLDVVVLRWRMWTVNSSSGQLSA